jgi:hypothetical protein
MTKKRSGGEQKHRLIILDAKCRVEQGLNEALSSIHMYRRRAGTGFAFGQTEGNRRSGIQTFQQTGMGDGL